MSQGIPDDAMPLCNSVSEQSVLGSILLLNEALDEVADFLKPRHFYFEKHQLIYAGIQRMAEAGLNGIDAVTLAEHLDSRGELKPVGGVPYILEVLAAVPHAAHVKFYGKDVLKYAQLRAIDEAGRKMCRDAHDRSLDVGDILAKADQRVQAATEFGLTEIDTSIKAHVQEAIATADEPKASRISTGLPSLDSRSGGMTIGALIIIAARTSMGKTALMLLILRLVAEQGINVLLFTLEMTRREVVERFLAAAVGCQTTDLWHASRREWVQQEGDILGSLPIDIDDTMPALPQMLAKMRVLVRNRNVRVVIVDYLQLVESGRKHDIREQEVAAVTRELKKAAQSLGVVMIVASQLNREVEKRTVKRPFLSDLRESGAIEQDADQVWLLWRPNKDSVAQEGVALDDNFAEVNVAKNRNGDLGSITLDWHGPTMRFRDRMAVDPAIANWDSP